MASSNITKLLREGEELVTVVKRYWLPSAGGGVVGVALALVAFFLVFPLFRLGLLGIIIFVLLFLSGIIVAARSWVLYQHNALVVTSQRLIDIDQLGFFERVISEAGWDKIQDLTYSVKGFFPTMLGYGTVTVQTAGTATNLAIKDVHRPHEVQLILTKCKDEYGRPADARQLSAAELVALVEKIKAGITTEELERILSERRRGRVGIRKDG